MFIGLNTYGHEAMRNSVLAVVSGSAMKLSVVPRSLLTPYVLTLLFDETTIPSRLTEPITVAGFVALITFSCVKSYVPL